MTKRILILFGLMLTVVLTAMSQQNISIRKMTPGDTVRLYTQYADCGEWGGHREHLKVFMTNELLMEYSKDTVSCENDSPDSMRRLLIRKTRPVQNNEMKLIDKYIRQVVKRSKERRYACSNAGNVFSVRTNETNFEFGDTCTDWDEFGVLIKKIFK